MASGAISTLGIGSGMDLQGILDSLRAADETLITKKTSKKNALIETREEFNAVNAKMLALKSHSLSLSLGSNYLKRNTSITDDSIINASAVDGTKISSHSISVSKLAVKHSFQSSGFASITGSVNIPTIQESTVGLEGIFNEGIEKPPILLKKGEEITITYGSGDNVKTIPYIGSPTKHILTIKNNFNSWSRKNIVKENIDEHLVSAQEYHDENGKWYLKFEVNTDKVQETGEARRLTVTTTSSVTSFSAPDKIFSYSLGETSTEISVPADTTLSGLADLINDDENNPGVTASIIDTGFGETPFHLVLTANETGEDNRITINKQLEDITMTALNGLKEEETLIEYEFGLKPSFVTITSPSGSYQNQTIRFIEDNGDGFPLDENEKEKDSYAIIKDGVYENGNDLAQAIENAFNEKTNNGTYNVTFSEETQNFKIIEKSGKLKEIKIKWDGSFAKKVFNGSGSQTINAFNEYEVGIKPAIITITSASTSTSVYQNQTISFSENTGDSSSINYNAEIKAGAYKNHNDLAQAIENAFNENSNDGVYSVIFSEISGRFKIKEESGNIKKLKIKWDVSSAINAFTGTDTETILKKEASTLNAEIVSNGITYERETNTINDVINGVTLSLKKTGDLSFSISKETSSIKDDIIGLITSMNEIITEIDANDDYDEETDTWGSLAKTSSIKVAKNSIITMMGTQINNIQGSISSFYDLGFEINRDGTVKIDEKILDEKIASNFDNISEFFSGNIDNNIIGMAEILKDKINEITNSSGIINNEKNSAQTKIDRINEQIDKETEKLNKRYEIMTKQFVQLDSFMKKIESQTNYVTQMFNSMLSSSKDS